MVGALIMAFGLRWVLFYVTNLTKTNASVVPLVYAVPAIASAVAILLLVTNTQIQARAFLSNLIGGILRSAQKLLRRKDKATTAEGGGA